jgi:hypothetical protein
MRRGDHRQRDHWREDYNSRSKFICRTHFHVLQQIFIVSDYLDEHKEVLLRDNSGHNESRLANEQMRKFFG